MTVIYRGRRYLVPDHVVTGTGLELTLDGDSPTLVRVELSDRDLIMAPSAEDLQLAEAFERGEISAFEYADGHTYPANREIGQPPTRTPRRIH
jgi:hypothetical protein